MDETKRFHWRPGRAAAALALLPTAFVVLFVFIGGLSAVSSKHIWVARPAPTECGNDQILPVDWCGITRKGQVKTNYQIMPFDRVYILSQPLTKFDTYMARVLSPVQRAFGVTLLGASTVNQIRNSGNGFGNNNGVNFVAPIIP